MPVEQRQRLADFKLDRQRLVAARQQLPGASRRHALADLTDEWVSELFADAAAPPQGVALVAVGGYGRRELSPGSDIDLVLLHSSGVKVGDLADAVWYPIWDSGLRLDHSVRTPAQARRMANSDLKVMLGLLDARTVAGDDSLLVGLRTSALADWRARAASRLGELREMVELRRNTFGELAYLQEPDLKDSIGGLRDVIIMRAIAASWVTDVPRARLADPYEFLLDVRDALHTLTGRSSDKLVRQEQPAIAELLGLPDPNGDGDGVLREVAAAGRTIDWACDMVWHRVDRLRRPSRLPGLKKLGRSRTPQRVPLTDGAVIDDGEVVLARDARPDRDPGLMLRLASATARAGLRVAPATVRRLAESSGPMPARWTDAMRNDFVGLIGAGRGLLPVWESLDQEGLIVRLLPEWEPSRSAPQHNPVHVHTVDRHALETTMKAAAYAREVARPDLLLVAALLHDIGKPAGAARHSEVGAEIVASMLPRMGFTGEDAKAIEQLVRQHLLIADTATRRDIHDADTVAMVAEAVGSPDQLEMLWALTKADAEATGPAAWSPWKAALVDSLAEHVAAVFAGRPDVGIPVPSEAESVALAAEDVVVLRDERGGLEELVIGAPKAELADIAGVLALHRLAVIEARASMGDERSVSTWRVTPAFGDVPDAHRIAVDLRRVLAGTLALHDRLHRRESSIPTAFEPPAPRVTVEPDASRTATVIEVRAADSPGLLYRLLATVARLGGHVRAAKVATLGADVVDVFYLVGDDGGRLPESRERSLCEALVVAATPADADG
ncbi:MAG: [protein-PII] uridylyltransferase [Actinobacteria bacterium]|nr:[protein-PII] uridylyltransferase [Actinomycetota bacterium]MCB9412879.1 [protein-PII] uridylyltransferase [Actinomycetota bacterium]